MKFYMCLGVLLCLFVGSLRAEGSRELYKKGKGNRAFLESVDPTFNAGNQYYNPMGTLGKHYVYVKAGETLAVASSAQNVGLGRIRIVSSSGKIYKTRANNTGRIMDKGLGTLRAEMDGPRKGYDPYEINISSDEEGVWSVEFFSPMGEFAMSNPAPHVPKVRANTDWKQPSEEFIAAWDISVRDKTDSEWIAGRVFTTVLTLRLHSGDMSDANGAFYGENYVLTNDGHTYKVDGNGSNGIYFSYFVNSKGFLDRAGNPLYKSINSTNYNAHIHNPNSQDEGENITHKLFYSLPDTQMPEEAIGKGFVGGGTWLYRSKNLARIDDLQLWGIEGVENKVSRKGNRISFSASRAGKYKLTIENASSSTDLRFVKRELVFDVQKGHNTYIWDGLDGEGELLPVGENYPIVLGLALMEGEIHFPYLDMEINPMGILIEEVADDGSLTPATVYWDDSDIAMGKIQEMSNPVINLTGIPSTINGHKWGTYTDTPVGQVVYDNDSYGGYSFGNNKGMDTWAYTARKIERIEKRITVRVTDLAVETIHSPKLLVIPGEEFSYTVIVKNEGPSLAEDAVMTVRIPAVLTLLEATLYSSCARESQKTVTVNHLNVHLRIPAGCEVQYILRVKAQDEIADDDFGAVPIEASIMRDLDTTDPDATDISMRGRTTRNLLEDCAENGRGGQCNNSLTKADVTLVLGVQQPTVPETKEPVLSDEDIGPVQIGKTRIGFLIPNTFTPNGDGKNDKFIIFGVEERTPIIVEVLNRYGKLVFSSKDYKNDWSAENLEDGSYFLIVRGRTHSGRRFLHKGHLSVIRKLYP